MKASLMNGVIVEGTPAEIAAVIRELQTEPFRTMRTGVVANGTTGWTDDALDIFWKELSAEQRRLIQYVLRKGSVTLKQLIEHLGKKNGVEVAGLLAAITRHGHNAAGPASIPVLGTVRNESGKGYEVSPEIRKRLEQLLSKE